jgi:hypothetical protein
MRVAEPFEIELQYVQRMMAWLLFVEPASVTKRHAMQLGLGAGAITKFCHKKLRLCTTAIELNPQVLAVCRQWFKLPPDGPKLRVVLADAAEEIEPDVAGHRGCPGGGSVRPRSRRAGARQPRLLCRLPRPADRGRLHDRQPVWPRVEL